MAADSAAAVAGQWTWLRLVIVAVGILWFLSILFVEYFFFFTRRLRSLDPKMKEKYGAFTNAPEKWNRFVFYLCTHTFAR